MNRFYWTEQAQDAFLDAVPDYVACPVDDKDVDACLTLHRGKIEAGAIRIGLDHVNRTVVLDYFGRMADQAAKA